MTPIACCAVPGCSERAATDTPLCVPHLLRVPAVASEALLAAWRVYELGQRQGDAEKYTRELCGVIRELALTSHPHRPVQLRLVK